MYILSSHLLVLSCPTCSTYSMKTYSRIPTENHIQELRWKALDKQKHRFTFLFLCVVFFSLFLFQTWITFSPIADLTSTYYKINAFKVNVLSLIFMVASVPFGFAASWVLDTYGLRTSVGVIKKYVFITAPTCI